MTCVLCDSWAGCPVNPHTSYPRPRTTITDQDVEGALLVGYVWGIVSKELCADHLEIVEEMKSKLGLRERCCDQDCRTQEEMIARHGDPQQFWEQCLEAQADGFITIDEARTATGRYKRIFEAAK